MNTDNSKTKTKALIVFPYRGYQDNEKNEWYFWWTIDSCKTIDPRPTVLIPRTTVIRDEASTFLNDPRAKDLEIVETWSVDTCQTWLSGWGHVLDNFPEAERVVLVPGDIDDIEEDVKFYDNFKDFIKSTDTDIAIGDFETADQHSAKSLVDIYGTYPLLANWFPEVSQSIQSLSLHRPRSEFLNIKTSVLRDLLIAHRSFAYEQTLNFLIQVWDYENEKWKCDISIFPLGNISDNKSLRDYRSCIDQIERIERMVCLLWREIKEPKKISDNDKEYKKQYATFGKEYDDLRTKSKGIMETARTTIQALLGV